MAAGIPVAPAPAKGAAKGPNVRPAAAMKNLGVKAPANKTAAKTALPRQGAKAPAARAPRNTTPAIFNPLQGYLSSPQLANVATSIAKSDQNAALTPLRQQATNLQGIQSTVGNRLAGYNQGAQQQIGQIQQDQQAQAKTLDNHMADIATRTAGQIDTSGQAARTLNAGYLDPAVAGELQSQRTMMGTTAGAAGQAVGQRNANEGDFLSNVRASAAQRGTELQGNVASHYGQLLGANAGQQQAQIAKFPGDLQKLQTSLGQTQFTDFLNQQGLGVKQQAANTSLLTAKSTAQTRAQQIGINSQNANTNATRANNTLALGQGRLSETIRHNQANEGIAAQRAAQAAKKAAGGLTTPAQDKLTGELGSAYQFISSQRTGPGSPAFGSLSQYLQLGRYPAPKTDANGKAILNSKGQPLTTNAPAPKISDPRVIQAAQDLYIYQKLSPTDVQALKSIGITQIPPEWITGGFQGFGVPNASTKSGAAKSLSSGANNAAKKIGGTVPGLVIK